MVKEQFDSLVLINSLAPETQKYHQTFTNKVTNYVASQSKTIKERKCLLQKQPSIIDLAAESLLQEINNAFTKANLISYEVSTKETLPRIISSTNICFFKLTSAKIQNLIIGINHSNSQKITILERLIVKIDNSKLLVKQKLIASDLIKSVIRCLQLSIDINDAVIWRDVVRISLAEATCAYSKHSFPKVNERNNPMLATQLMLYPISIDLLCIEEEKRFKNSLLNKKNNIIDLGIHALDNEWLYMERCYRGFLYMLNLQQQAKTPKINFANLRNVNAILGGCSAYPNTCYSCSVPSNIGDEFLQLVSQGLIANHNSNENLSVVERMKELEIFFEAKLDIKIKLKQVLFNDKIYFTVDTPAKKSAKSDKSSFNQQEQQLLDDLHGKTDNKAFIFIIKNREGKFSDTHPIIMDILYCYSQDKASVCQQLLDIYYKKLIDLPDNKIKKINLAVGLCSIMQRIHPFCDANGRTLFFILFPILLYQMDIWLTRMIRNPWLLLEFFAPEMITERILPLCVPVPEFTKQVDWHKYISVTEIMRISVALGDLTKINELITKRPSLLSQKIIVSPMSDAISLIEYSIRHDQLTVLKFLLSQLSKETLKAIQLTDMLSICDNLQRYQIKVELIKYLHQAD